MQLIQLVERLAGVRVLLVGDLMVDRYVFGNAERVSPEAPVPVLHFQQEQFRLGGAANVAANLATLGAKVRVVGMLGRDEMAIKARALLAELSVEEDGIVEVVGRPTVCKMRLVGSAQHRHAQQMLRLDFEDGSPVPASAGEELVARAEAAMDWADIVVLEDYNKGVLTAEVSRKIIAAARGAGKAVIVDPALNADYSKYKGSSALKLNRPEACRASGMSLGDEKQCEAAADVLLKNLELDAVIVTLDKEGAYLATRAGERRKLATRARQVYDVTGAGDMLLATLATARGAGAEWAEATALANVSAGLEVEKFGTVPITPSEIVHELLSEARLSMGKQRTIEQLTPELARHRAAGKKIVFTNGCFDLIHLGHVKYFRFAKAQGDLLVVGVNTDASIRRLKGPKRPVVNEEDRVGVLEELGSIDYVVRFDEDTPKEMIERVRPDVLVKGADYAKEQVVGWDFVESYGGRVALAPLVDGRSTSNVIERIVKAYSGD